MRRLSLSGQFLVAAAAVLCVVMAVLGTWMNNRITRSVLATTGADGRALIQGLIGPLIQSIEPDGTLPDSVHEALDKLFVDTPIGKNIVSVKLWRKDQVVIYSSMSKDVIGKQFVSTDVAKAFEGQTVAEFDDMVSAESAYEQTLGLPIIEVYAPLYRTGTKQILAVGEVYDDARELAAELRESIWRTWLVVTITTIFMLAVLYGIVRRGSRTIRSQQAALDHQLIAANEWAEQNAELRTVAERTRLDANNANEQLIGRIGQDLHDGPVQLLSLSMLRLSQLGPKASEEKRARAVAEIQTLTENVIRELRTLSTGLVLPEIENLSPAKAIELAIYRHENQTGSRVVRRIGELSADISDPLKICMYRIVQESLTNSFRHAGGIGQQVEVAQTEIGLELTISDKGKGFPDSGEFVSKQEKLGLRGIHSRAQAFGGYVAIYSDDRTGTRVSVTLPVGETR